MRVRNKDSALPASSHSVAVQKTTNKTSVDFRKTDRLENSSALLDGLQYLRGLCAVIVVVSHCNGIIAKPEHYSRLAIPDWSAASLFAVAAFFSISGFIIVIASLDENVNPRVTRGEFLRRRFVRIVPFLWLCTIGYNLLSLAGTGSLDAAAAARTLILWPIGELKPNVAWSLRHELLFYAAFAVAMLGAARRPKWLIAWLAVSVVFYLVSYDLGAVPTNVLQTSGFLLLKVAMGGDHGANFQFAAGMLLAYAYLLHPRSLPLKTVPMAGLIVGLALAGLIVSWAPQNFSLGVCLLWTVLAAVVLAAAICVRANTGLPGKAGLVLGNASFAIYLVHNPIVLVLLAVAQKAGLALESEAALLGFLAGAVVVSVGGGVLVHYWIEKPLIRACDRWSRGITMQ
jgi:peptidoglycan/LPS O-acetylase OafA/YrhL